MLLMGQDTRVTPFKDLLPKVSGLSHSQTTNWSRGLVRQSSAPAHARQPKRASPLTGNRVSFSLS